MVSDAERLQELEVRLNAVERRVRALERGPLGFRGLLERLLPREVRDHLGTAQREYFLAWRSYLDLLIGRTETEQEQKRVRPIRRRVEVE